MMMRHKDKLDEHFKASLNIDIEETINAHRPSVLYFDDVFTAPFFGYESQDDYYRKASSIHRIHENKTPTVYMHA